MKVITGNKISEKIKLGLKQQVEKLEKNPVLAIIFFGQNDASQLYVNKKIDFAKEIEIDVELITFENPTTTEVISEIENLNKNTNITGIMVQLPILKQLDLNAILSAISIEKDVDGLNPLSLGKLWQDDFSGFAPATPLAVLECLRYVATYTDGKYTEEELSNTNKILSKYLRGKNILIINSSIIVGKPLAALLINLGATVQIAHKYTDGKALFKMIEDNDIVITGTGISNFIGKDQIRDGQVVIDIGINKSALGVGGDIDPRGIEDRDIWITPVPGGIGPITVAKLMENVLKAATT